MSIFTTNCFILSTITTFRIARMGSPGFFTKDVMHSQIDDADDDNNDDADNSVFE